ncbi:MAG: hypothetical protein JWR06_254, partial [Jatrophihabitans sp.]|nr:hypothetical protein [Jatrophihabitans sp.]
VAALESLLRELGVDGAAIPQDVALPDGHEFYLP